MVYTYRQIRDMAWEFLIKNQVKSLPIDLHDIIQKNHWIALPQAHELITFLDKDKRYSGLPACTYYFNNKYIIAYDPSTPYRVLRFAIAHEIGHIVLFHLIDQTEKYEQEAQLFAARILMPMIVLNKIKVKSHYHLAVLCKVSPVAANYRYKRLQMLINRNKFLLSPLEAKVYEQFEDFINQHNNRILHFEASKEFLPQIIRPLFQLKVYNHSAAAGLGNYLTDDDSFEMIDVPYIPLGTDFGIRISGNSMEPIINDGDIVFIRQQLAIANGEIGIFIYNNEAFCKQLKITINKIILHSLNPRYQDILINNSSFQCIGKYLGKTKN